MNIIVCTAKCWDEIKDKSEGWTWQESEYMPDDRWVMRLDNRVVATFYLEKK